MLTTIVAPDKLLIENAKYVFLAGGITNCPDWQNTLTKLITAPSDKNCVVFNPRRPFEPSSIEEQIYWEFTRIRASDAILFWFPRETLCPITLFELGSCISMPQARSIIPKPLFVGCHPEYQRKNDIVLQLKLARPEISVKASLQEVADQVSDFFNK